MTAHQRRAEQVGDLRRRALLRQGKGQLGRLGRHRDDRARSGRKSKSLRYS